MKIGGNPNRIELKFENEFEKECLQRIVNGDVTAFFGDSEFPGGAVILNTARSGDPREMSLPFNGKTDARPL